MKALLAQFQHQPVIDKKHGSGDMSLVWSVFRTAVDLMKWSNSCDTTVINTLIITEREYDDKIFNFICFTRPAVMLLCRSYSLFIVKIYRSLPYHVAHLATNAKLAPITALA